MYCSQGQAVEAWRGVSTEAWEAVRSLAPASPHRTGAQVTNYAAASMPPHVREWSLTLPWRRPEVAA